MPRSATSAARPIQPTAGTGSCEQSTTMASKTSRKSMSSGLLALLRATGTMMVARCEDVKFPASVVTLVTNEVQKLRLDMFPEVTWYPYHVVIVPRGFVAVLV